jgi:hypothetical protein
MISVKEYDPKVFYEVMHFCKRQLDDSEVSNNMWIPQWRSDPSTLLYILKRNDRFSGNQGRFHLLYDDEKIIGCGGVYISDFSPRVAIAGVRTWIDKDYRNFQYMKDFILIENRNWAIEQSIDVVALSFNYYNKNLIKLFTRGQKIGTRTDRHMFYKNFNVVESPVMIRNMPQWIIYENLTDYRFDWNQIKCEAGK